MSYLLKFEFNAYGAYEVPTFVVLDETQYQLFFKHNAGQHNFTNQYITCNGSDVSDESNNCCFASAEAIPSLPDAARTLLHNVSLGKQINTYIRRKEALFVLVNYRRRCDSEIPFLSRQCSKCDSDCVSVPLTSEDFEVFLNENRYYRKSIRALECDIHQVSSEYRYDGFVCVLPEEVVGKELKRSGLIEVYFSNEFELEPLTKSRIRKLKRKYGVSK